MSGTKKDWPVASTRVSPAEMEKLKKKHPNRGSLSIHLRALIKMYLAGRIYIPTEYKKNVYEGPFID